MTLPISYESVLVIVIAETRAYEHTFDLFRSNVLDVLHADLALCVADNESQKRDNPFYQNAKHVWTYKEPLDWGDAFDSVQKIEGCQGDWRKLLEIKDIWLGGIHGKEGRMKGSGAVLLFFRWFLKTSILSSDILEQYDRFIITRSDYIYRIPHFPIHLLNSDFIWIPDGEDYGGYTDRHIVVNRKDLISVLSVLDPILCNPEELYSKMSCRQDWDLEKYLKFAFIALGLDSKIRRFPYTMYAIRPVDGRTSWSLGFFIKKLGYYVKYDEEYKGFLLASKTIKTFDDWTIRNTFVINQVLGAAKKITAALSPYDKKYNMPTKAIKYVLYRIARTNYLYEYILSNLCIVLVLATSLGIIFRSHTQIMVDKGFNQES